MKYVQVLKDILVISIEGKNERQEIWSFYKYLLELVLSDLAMGTGYAYTKARSIIKEKFRKAKVGDWVELEDEQWKLLRLVLIEPKGSPNTFQKSLDVLEQFIPFMEAIVLEENVKTEKPKLENPPKWVD